MASITPARVAEAVLHGERRAIARAISLIENDAPAAEAVLRGIFGSTGRAYRVGVTGPPGAGKSTLSNKLAARYRAQGRNVGVIAVDPTSPFTGGALLGDRIRMTDVALDGGVFIRSMATRGSLGGLSRRAKDAADVLDAAGKDVIVFETVGVGQSELDIADAADTTVVVLVPESGDAVQAMKAGLMEIADLFVMNKSDREGAEQAMTALRTVLQFRVTHAAGEWIPPVVRTVATAATGIDELLAAIDDHRAHAVATGGLESKRTRQMRDRVRALVEQHLHIDFWTPDRLRLLDAELGGVVARLRSPYELSDMLRRV